MERDLLSGLYKSPPSPAHLFNELWPRFAEVSIQPWQNNERLRLSISRRYAVRLVRGDASRQGIDTVRVDDLKEDYPFPVYGTIARAAEDALYWTTNRPVMRISPANEIRCFADLLSIPIKLEIIDYKGFRSLRLTRRKPVGRWPSFIPSGTPEHYLFDACLQYWASCGFWYNEGNNEHRPEEQDRKLQAFLEKLEDLRAKENTSLRAA